MPCSQVNSPLASRETVTLLEEIDQKRCCFGRFRVYGSDGVLSWGVAFANFLVNFIIVGLGRMGAMFYVDFINFFGIDRKTAAIPFSAQQAARNLFGPVAGILGEKYGIRTVTIIGGIIGCLSASLEYFKMDITYLTFLWGIFFGLSTALTTTINQVSIDQYFDKYRATAGGFAFSGGCIGAMFFPIVIETLIDNYGMQGTFLVMGAIILHVVPAAMLLVEPSWKKKPKITVAWSIKQYGALDEIKQIHPVIISQEPKQKQDGLASSRINFKILEENGDMVYQFLTMNISDGSVRSKLNQNVTHSFDKQQMLNTLKDIYHLVAEQEMNENNPSLSNLIQKAISNKPTSRHRDNGLTDVLMHDGDTDHANIDMQYRVFIERKLQELSGMRGTRIISHFPYPEQHRAWKVLIELRQLTEELSNLPANQILNGETYHPISTEHAIYDNQAKAAKEFSDSLEMTNHSNSICNHIKTALHLHKNPLFLLICLCRGVFMLTFVPVAIIAVDFATDHGLQKSDGKYVVAILSLGDFLGRTGLGWVTDHKYLSLSKYMVLAMIALGGSTASLPFMNCKTSVLVSIFIFAILQGSLFVRHPILVSNYVKSHEKSIGMGFINFLSGFLGFALPNYIGYFRDDLGSYDCLFFVNGGICILVGLLWLLEPVLVYFITPKSETLQIIKSI